MKVTTRRQTLRMFLSSDRRQRRAPVAAVVLFVLLVLAFFRKMAFSGLILARGDTFLYFYPYWDMASQALREGRVPLWNDHIFMGAPFVANSQVGFFYPLNWPLWLLLPVPYAVSASIILHIIIAGWGMFVLARRALRASVVAALMAAAVFALGGYLTAQVEHVNQLQGLAWMPWLFVVLGVGGNPERRQVAQRILWGSLIIALQLLAGHTQSLFISLVGLVIFRVANLVAVERIENGKAGRERTGFLSPLAAVLGVIVVAAVVAMGLAAVQLAPTLELMQLSGREGGLPLNEAVSFSLHPLLVAQALLPGPGMGQFTEYIAALPLTVLLLAFLGAWHWRRMPAVAPPLALVASGLFLAFGRFNPVYLLLAHLPGFSYFRAPARWMVLYAFGVALLVAIGLDLARGGRQPHVFRVSESAIRWGGAAIVGLIVLSVGSAWLARSVAVGAESAVVMPGWTQTGMWLIELAVAAGLIGALLRGNLAYRQEAVAVIGIMALFLWFISTRPLPYNRLTTPEAYFDLRPPIARLQGLESCGLQPTGCEAAPYRFLSMSDIFFDPGDLAELQSIFGDWLAEDAFFDYVVAVKQKEIIAPNLPMSFGLASVDGFDGGILPLRDFSTAMDLVLPAGTSATDGRLREYLERIPDAQWLDLFGARYIITDKVGDEWRQEVFFDTQHARTVEAGERLTVGALPDYEATEMWLLGELDGVRARLVDVDGNPWEGATEALEEGLWRVALQQPAMLQDLELWREEASWSLRGMALVDTRDNTFHVLTPGDYHLIYSGDVKIYENLDVLPRAFVVERWSWADNAEAAIEAMKDGEFRPEREAVIAGTGDPATSNAQGTWHVEVERYAPGDVALVVNGEGDGLLVLTDTYYPGWEATIDGEPVRVEKVNGMFRGVFMGDGRHEVRFTYRPASFAVGLWTTLIVAVLWLGLQVMTRRTRQEGGSSGSRSTLHH